MLPLRPVLRLSLLAAALVAANLAHADVPAGAPFTPEQQQLIRQLSASEVRAAAPKIASEAASSVAKTIEGERLAISNTKEWLEVGRKNIDWWLGFLSLLLAGAAIFVWRTNEKNRQEWETIRSQMGEDHRKALQETADTRGALRQEMQTCIKDAKERFDQHLKITEGSVRLLERDLERGRQMLAEIQQHRDSAVAPRANAPAWEIEAAKKLNEANAAHSPQSKLAALAQRFDQEGNWQEAVPRWQALTDLEPENADYWFNYGYALNHWIKQSKEPEQVRQLAGQAQAVWQQVITLRPTDADAYNNLGVVLSDLAKSETGTARKQHFTAACSKFAEATRVQSKYVHGLYNWGSALSELAQAETGEVRQRYLEDACSKFAEATRLQPDDADTYCNWGVALLHLVHIFSGAKHETILNEAERVLLQAKVLGHANLYNLACLRAIQSRADEARELLLQTREAGYLPDYEHLGTDKDLNGLRELEWFQQLLEEVRQQEATQVFQPA